MIKIFYFSLLHFLAFRLPKKVSYAIAWFISYLNFVFNFSTRKGVILNISVMMEYQGKDPRQACVKKEIKAIARGTFVNFGKYLVDFFAAGKLNKDFLKDNVTLEKIESIDEALSHKRGSVIISAHLGNWELGGIVLALLGYPINVVVLPHTNEKVNSMFVEKRLKQGIKVIPVGYSVRRCYEALKKNEFVALLGDRDTTSNGVERVFFGRKCILPRGPVDMAVRTGADITFGFFVRESGGKYRFNFDGPIITEKGVTKDELWEKIINKMQEQILKYPDQWFVFYPLWPELGT